MHAISREFSDLCTLIAHVSKPEDARDLLIDLLTPQEIETISQRWQVVLQLAKGKKQRDIARELGVSIAMVTRGSTMLKFGTGGFHKFLPKCAPQVHPLQKKRLKLAHRE